MEPNTTFIRLWTVGYDADTDPNLFWNFRRRLLMPAAS